MTKEPCSLQPNYYGNACDFQDLQTAVQQLTTKSEAQFEELKNEKWYHRIFNIVVCPRKNNIRMADQITSLAQAQGILIEILVRLADQDANIAGMVMQSQSDIRALAQNSAYLQERLYLLEDKSYGIKENENLRDLNSQQRNILCGCLNDASRLYANPSSEQRLFANELLNYLNADARVENLEDALDDLEDNAKRKILSCVITYLYLYDHTAESMEQDAQEDFIDLFDLGRKTLKALKQQTADTYHLRGVDGCIDRYITAPIEITEETPFEVELPEPETAEAATADNTVAKSEDAIDTSAPREKLVLSGMIQATGETVYQNKDIHFSAAVMKCQGTLKFINCTLHYNEDGNDRIFLEEGTSLLIASSTVICHGERDKEDFFIRGVEVANEWGTCALGTCAITNTCFMESLNFVKGCFTTFDFENNVVHGLYYALANVKAKERAKICNSRFDYQKHSFRKEAEKGYAGYRVAILSLDNQSDYEPAEVHVDNCIFVGNEKFNPPDWKQTLRETPEDKSIEPEYKAIHGPSSRIRYNKEAMGVVSNCTFLRMEECISGMDTVRNCVFDHCRDCVDECGSQVTECRFTTCGAACDEHTSHGTVCNDLFGEAVVSNCQFTNCNGRSLICTDLDSEIKIQDCEFANIGVLEENIWDYYFQSIISFGTAQTKFANNGHQSEVTRCVFNGICISRKKRSSKKDEQAYIVVAQVGCTDKFKFPRAVVSDCTFMNCAAPHDLVLTEPYDSLFGRKHNYTAVRLRNNTGLDQIGTPATFAESQNVKLKETDAAGNKIGSSLPV